MNTHTLNRNLPLMNTDMPGHIFFAKTRALINISSVFCLKTPVLIGDFICRFYRRLLVSIGSKKSHLSKASILLCLSVFICGSLSTHAQMQTPQGDLPPPELAQRMKKLESELRCLVCQNQTLAESPAGLAGDLRREVRSLIEQGKTDDEIKTYLQARYGDFVLYKPPVDPKTYLLWFGPFGLLGGGAILVWWVARRRQLIATEAAPEAVDVEVKRRARNLLDDDEKNDR
ncbi:MAG: cytochrome c-type biogenesis protein [Pseudomonadota bacterium]